MMRYSYARRNDLFPPPPTPARGDGRARNVAQKVIDRLEALSAQRPDDDDLREAIECLKKYQAETGRGG